MRLKVMLSLVVVVVVLLSTSTAFAGWPDDPDLNMLISSDSGSQAIPLVKGTSDGGCYISWYSNASGNYDMYLQRLNDEGEIQWVENGLLISDNLQESWLTDYSITVDSDNNAIVVFNDKRSGGDWDIYAYKISPEGDFLWGDDGIAISDNDTYEAIPQVITTSDGNVVIAWQEEYIVHIRKLDSDGNDYWDSPNVIDLTSEYGMSIPRLAPAEDDAFIIQALFHTSSSYWSTRYIYLYKFSDSGNLVWGDSAVVVSDGGGVGIQMTPEMISDGQGGAYSFWYDSRISSELHTYAQHINSDGDALWEEDGVRLSYSSSQFQMGSPALTYFEDTGDVMIFYKITNTTQSISGIGGQMLNSAGELQWGDNGVDLLSLANKSRYSVSAYSFESDAVVICFDSPEGDVVNGYVDAMRINTNGEHVWTEAPLMICSHVSDKIHLATGVTANNQYVAAWEDDYYGTYDIIMQNVNPDGTLGDYVTGITSQDVALPQLTGLKMAYPNPFNATTTINYCLTKSSDVNLEVYDLLGRKVVTLVNEYQAAGDYNVRWQADQYSTGVYFARLITDQSSSIKKLVFLK